ncbi:MAG: ABC transporter permease protein [Candidatus Peribacteria bacterium GW2011_GWB1_54_5]|nr:MAG: ABC transporter permease protein [Candidatus Peribacteria bacterium GW2011_GWB1_54_5]
MEVLILSQISSIGAQSMVVFPGQKEGVESTLAAGFDSLTFDDVEALERLTTITSVAPAIFVDIPTAVYGREKTQPRVIATTPPYFQNREMPVAVGRVLEERDIMRARHVVVLGSDIADDLFGLEDPVGKQVRLGDLQYTVVGVLEPVGTQFFQNADEFVFIPLTTGRAVTGQKHVNVITLQAVGDFDLAQADVESLLRQRHGIVNPEGDTDEDDFIVRTSQQANDILGAVSLGLTLFITTIAGISLVVGGIGIMNIMLVAVTERTREIGLRKAVGARGRDILLQFLFEAILLTLFAGIAGVVFGVGLAGLAALIVDKYLESYDFALSVPAIGLALAMAILTGLVFGIYPARQASKLSPMNALRYE